MLEMIVATLTETEECGAADEQRTRLISKLQHYPVDINLLYRFVLMYYLKLAGEKYASQFVWDLSTQDGNVNIFN
jgi:hypothetical protein